MVREFLTHVATQPLLVDCVIPFCVNSTNMSAASTSALLGTRIVDTMSVICCRWITTWNEVPG